MRVAERILTIRLLEKMEADPEHAKKLGLEKIEKRSKDYGKNNRFPL